MIKAITFDLDMTLIDFLKMKRLASNAAAKAMVKAGLEMQVKKAQKKLFDTYMKDIEGQHVFQDFLKDHKSSSDRILAAALNAYLKVKSKHLKSYPKVKFVLNSLKRKGLKLGIITDAPRLQAYMRLDAMDLVDCFDVVVCLEDTGKTKPSPEPFKKACRLLKLKPAEVMHVGDWPERDVKGAKKVGMKTCFANYQRKKGKIKADCEIGSIEEEIITLASRARQTFKKSLIKTRAA